MQVLMTGPSLSREEREGAALSPHFLINVCPALWLNISWGIKGPQGPYLPFHRPREVQGGPMETARRDKPDPEHRSPRVLVWEATQGNEGAKQTELVSNCACHEFSSKMEITLWDTCRT